MPASSAELPAATLAELNELLWAIPTSRDPVGLVAVVLERCSRLFDSPLACVFLRRDGHTPEPASYEMLGAYGFTAKKAEQLWAQLDLPLALPQAVHRTGQDAARAGVFGKRRLGALVASPMRGTGTEAWLVLARLAPHPYSEFERQFLAMITARVASALEQANRDRQTRERTHELELLNAIGDLLVGTMHLDELLQSVVVRIADSLELSCCSIFLVEPGTVYLRERASCTRDDDLSRRGAGFRPLRSDEGASSQVVASRQAYIARDIATDPVIPADAKTVLGDGSIMILPLIAGGEVVGAMYWTRDTQHPPFEAENLPMAMHLAGQVALALETARRFGEMEARCARHLATLRDEIHMLRTHGDAPPRTLTCLTALVGELEGQKP